MKHGMCWLGTLIQRQSKSLNKRIKQHGLSRLVFVQTGELRQAEWTDTGFDKEEWRIPGYKMKIKEQHIVPYHTSSNWDEWPGTVSTV
ncbi:hypothetical protein [Nitrosomonas communis]|nr:hypothetical protein [Nitrosomonas communis]